MGPKTTWEFWSNWPPKLTLEVVPLKCVSRQQKIPLWVPISIVFSSKMQVDVGEKRSTTATVKIMSGENWRELRPCGYPSSLREAAAHGAQFTASQETTARNCREFRPCQRRFLCIDRTVLRLCRYPSSVREAAAQFTASQETTARNCREFRLCDGLFFVHQPHSSQQNKQQSKKISENKKSVAQVLKSEMRHICLQFSLSRPGGMREAIKINKYVSK